MNTVGRRAMALALAAFVGQFGSGAALAGFMECSGMETLKEETSGTLISPGPNRELGQIVRVWRVASKNPEFDGIEKTVYMHIDQLNGTGTHSGYWVLVLKSGERLRAKFEGAHFTVTSGGHWETAFQGVFHFIAGTGNYEAIRGGGHYRGVEKPATMTEEIGCVASY